MKRVVAGILVNDGLVLACQRKETARYPLKWEFPGGKVEPGEAAQEALARELHEELAITAVIGATFHVQEWTYDDADPAQSDSGAFQVTYFLVDSFTGEMQNRAFKEIRWVKPATLQTMDILEGNQEVVDLLVNHGTVTDYSR
jgi:8-oxo-dGTP diphosphatase